MIKAIDTFYNGNYYRSRLEARWAVAFDYFGIKYEYEPEGFVLTNGVSYLPDFYLPEFNCYAEVKPSLGAIEIKPDENQLARDYERFILNHPDYKTKWVPFSNEKTLLLLIDRPHPYPIPMLYKPHEKHCPDGIELVGFHEESSGVKRFWTWCCGHEEFPAFENAAAHANYKRFEHGQ
jgi:hypothetical protein